MQLNFDDRPTGFDGRALLSPVGAPYAAFGASVGVDFNPTVDRIRLITDADTNLRLNPDTGARTQDAALQYGATDRNRGTNPTATGAAYTHAPFGGMTRLYDIDSGLDSLALQAPPNDGTLTTVGALGVKVTDNVGFDIGTGKSRSLSWKYGPWRSGMGVSTTSVGYAALQPEGSSGSNLYRIGLRTGRAVSAGPIGIGQPLESLAVLTR